MSVVDSVFMAGAESVGQVAGWVEEVVGAEVMAGDGEVARLRVRAGTVDEWLGMVVQPNGYVEADPEPDEIQAMDGYGVEVQIRGGRSDEVLHVEAGLIFEKLVAARPDVPMLLVRNLDTLVAAHLPSVGTHTFDPAITPDPPDDVVWRSWVVS
jgi:hypothetical protein